MDVLVEKMVFAWMSMNLRKGKSTGNDGCYHWFAFWICTLLGFAALPGDEPLPFNKLLFPHVPTPLLLLGMVAVVLQGNVFNFPVWCLCNKKQMFLGMHCQSGGGVESTFCMGWQCQSLCCKLSFCVIIWETVSWFCNARQRTLHLQNGIKQGEQGGTVLNLFGFFLEKCVLNINLGGAVMNHCIRESHKFRSPWYILHVFHHVFVVSVSCKILLWGKKTRLLGRFLLVALMPLRP